MIAAACVAMLTACGDSGYNGPDNTESYKSVTGGVFIPADEDAIPTLLPETEYTFLRYYDGTGMWQVKADGIILPGLTTIGFTSPKVLGMIIGNNINLNFYPFTATGGQSITDFECLLTNNYYCYVRESDTNYIPDGAPLGQFLFASYKVDNIGTVHTFPRNAFYKGETTTDFTMGGVQQTFSSGNALYQLIMDLSNREATLVIYNVQFAAQMPIQTRMEIKNLKIEPNRQTGYVIKGENLVPVCGTGAGAVEYPAFVFNNVEITTVNDKMSKLSIDFNVAGRFHGAFTGSCLRD